MALPRAKRKPKIDEVSSLFVEDALPSGVKEIIPQPLAAVPSLEDTYPWRKWYNTIDAWSLCCKALHPTMGVPKRGSWSQCVLFGVVKNGVFNPSPTSNCFASIMRMGGNMQYVLSFLVDYKATEEHRFYLDWLVTRSPWAKVFLEKDLDIIIEGGLIADANHPSNLVVGGLIASRAFRECPACIPVFKALCDQGVVENLAYILSQMVYKPSSTQIKWTKESDNHTAIAPEKFSKKSLANFLNGVMGKPHANLSENTGYLAEYGAEGGIFGAWGKIRTPDATWLATYIRDNYTYGDVAANSDNPFMKAHTATSDKVDVAIEKMAKLSHKILQELELEQDR